MLTKIIVFHSFFQPYVRMPDRKPKVQLDARPAFNIIPKTEEKYAGTVYTNGSLRFEAVLNLIDISSNKNTYFKLQMLKFPYLDSK